MRNAHAFAVLLVALALGCAKDRPNPTAEPTSTSTARSAGLLGLVPPAVRTEKLEVPNDRHAYAVRGARAHRLTMVFLAGMCSHPEGYAMSIQHTAASRGDLVALQGDVSCGGDGTFRSWSSDLEKLNGRIDAAFEAAGHGRPAEVLVIGYSQGAERAEKLVARWPEKYSRAILIAHPKPPSAQRMKKAKGVVLMAGSKDGAKAHMQAATLPLQRAGVTSAYFTLPNATHGSMGDTPEESMTAALDVLDRPADQHENDPR